MSAFTTTALSLRSSSSIARGQSADTILRSIRSPSPFLITTSVHLSHCCCRRRPHLHNASTRNSSSGNHGKAVVLKRLYSTNIASPQTLTEAPSMKSDHSDRSILSLITAASEKDSEETFSTTVNGWIRSIRRMKNVCFADIRDGSTSYAFQVVLTKAQAEGLSNGSAVRITGTLAKSANQNAQKHELIAEDVVLLGGSDAKDYPLQKKHHSSVFLRSIPHMRCRSTYQNLSLRLRSWVNRRTSTFFNDRDFLQAHPPILTSTDCEGAGESFNIATRKGDMSFFSKETHLTVSTQLHLEAIAQSVPKVWSLSPTFRAEVSDTMRHLSEFYMLEVETAFVDDLDEVMDIVEDYISSTAGELLQSQIGTELLAYYENQEASSITSQDLQNRWKNLADSIRWPRISYTEAIVALEHAVVTKNAEFEFPVAWGFSLQSEHERFVAAHFGQGRPVFVTDYPTHIKPFYMLPSKSREPIASNDSSTKKKTVACFDLLFPQTGEMAGGSLREHRYAELREKMLEYFSKDNINNSQNETSNIDDDACGTRDEPSTTADGHTDGVPANLQWYLELRKWGSVPHGGFGIGFDRLLSYLSGTENIKDVATFPRWSGRCDC